MSQQIYNHVEMLHDEPLERTTSKKEIERQRSTNLLWLRLVYEQDRFCFQRELLEHVVL